MKLGDAENPPPAPDTAANGAGTGFSGLPFELFNRDYRLWILALRRHWLWLAGLPFVCALAVFIYITLFIPLRYESSCSLVRRELQSSRQNGLPEEYRPIQMGVILNMLRSRGNLRETITRLNLRMLPDALFNLVGIQLPGRNANYIYLSATTGDPELSANIVNTLATVFIEDYRKLIRSNMIDAVANMEKNMVGLNREIEAENNKRQELCARYHAVDIDSELAKINSQLIATESNIAAETTLHNSTQSKIANLRAALAKIPAEVQLYQEKNTESQTSLARAKMELVQLRQAYTDASTKVQKQIEIVRMMEEELKRQERGEGTQYKVVVGQNPVYTNLATEIAKLDVELAGCISRVREYQTALKTLYERRVALNAAQPEYVAMTERIDQKKRMLGRIEESKKTVEMFLERSYSDVAIYEAAATPTRPLPQHRLVTSAMMGFFALLLTALVVLGVEAANLKVRSRVDVTDALHLELLGAIPELDGGQRSVFYSAMQQLADALDVLLVHDNGPARLMIAPLSDVDFSRLQNDMLELLSMRNLKTVLIKAQSTVAPEHAGHLINDFLYGLTETLPKPDAENTVYFLLDDMAFITPPTPERLRLLEEGLGAYDWVIWNLFEYHYDAQLFVQLCEHSDLTILPLRFGVTDKLKIWGALKVLRTSPIRKLCAVLYEVKINSYSLVSL